MYIRSVTEADISSLAKLAQTVYSDTFGSGMSEVELVEALETRSEEYFRSVLDKDTILIAQDNGKLLGFIQFGEPTYDSIETTDADLELNKIYIDKDQQGKGIGKQLMEAMLSHDRLKNIENIYLDVYAQNEKALGLYTKYGFETIEKVPFKVKGKILGYDLLMKKSFSSL